MSELLSRLAPKDLCSLAQTVTSRLVVPETSSEAVTAILLHTDRPQDLLRRRKIKRELLFKYLHAKRVSVEATADKAVYMASVLQLWGSQQPLNLNGSEGNLSRPLIEEDSLPEAPAPSRNTSYSSLCNLDYGEARGHHALVNVVRQFEVDEAAGLRSDDDEGDCMVDSRSDGQTASEAGEASGEAMEMADSFVRWFYPLLNETVLNGGRLKEFVTGGHFWPDAHGKVVVQQASGGPSDLKTVRDNGPAVAEMLAQVAAKHRLTHNPNTSREGVSGVVDAHGLALVTACGTLHSGPRACGTFHHQFGLIRDPTTLGNNWKIKFTSALLVAAEAVHQTPRLAEANKTLLSIQQLSSTNPNQQPPSGSSEPLTSAMALS